MIRFLLLLLLFAPHSAQALTRYQGENSLFQDTVWEGEVLIDGILTVAMGVTLEIRPGTVIRFSRFDSNKDQIGEHEIFIQGRLLARGTTDQPIVFTSAEESPRVGDWGAINMMMSEFEPNIMEHCLVEYGYRGFHSHFSRAELRHSQFQFNQRGAQFQESDVLIEDCEFRNNFNGVQFRDSKVLLKDSRIAENSWGVRAVFADLEMEGSTIIGNRINGVSLRDSEFVLRRNQIVQNRRGFYLQRSRGEAFKNQIAGNYEHGIYLEDSLIDMRQNRVADNGRSGLKVLHAGGDVQGNQFEGNHQVTFVNDGEEDFYVGENSYSGKLKIIDQELRSALGKILVP